MDREERTPALLLRELEAAQRRIADLEQALDRVADGEDELRDRTAELEALLAALPDLSFRLDSDGTVRDFHAGQAADLYTTPDKFLGRRMQDLLPPEVGRQCQEAIERALAGSTVSLEYQLSVPDGEKHFEARVLPLLESEVYVLVRDITDRLRAERAAQEEVDFTNAVLDSMIDTVFVFDPATGQAIRWNRAFREISGYSDDEIAARKAPDSWYSEEDLHRAASGVADLTSNRLSRVELGLVSKDGRTIPTEYVAKTMDCPQGTPYSISIGRDITERKRAEETLRESELRFRRIIESSPMGIHMYELRDDGKLIFCGSNPAADQILGIENSQFIGKTIEEAFPPLADTEVPARYRDAAARGVPWRTEQIGYQEGEIAGAFEVTAFQVDAGKMVAVFQDITGRKQSEQERLHLVAQVQQAQKLESLGILAGGIAHDFNNILGSLLGNAAVALRQCPSHSSMHNLLLDIQKAGRRAADLTSQMLAFSGQGMFVVRDTDITALVQDMSSLLESSTSKKVRLSYELSADLPAVAADATQLGQIVLNLVTNASEAIGDQSGLVRVRTYARDYDRAVLAAASPDRELAEGRYVAIEVIDTGSGMDDQTKARVFDPFFTTKFTGRGLGMAAAQGIIRAHHGAILLESAPGRGTRFKVLLPALDHPAAAIAARAEEQSAWRGSGTILVVDDEEALRMVASRMLELLGFDVVTASDGSQAVDLFRERSHEIACVILDLKMPRMDGQEAYEELRKISDAVPVILTSGYSEQESTKQFGDKGLAGFLKKPYDMTSLEGCLRGVFGEPGLAPRQ